MIKTFSLPLLTLILLTLFPSCSRSFSMRDQLLLHGRVAEMKSVDYVAVAGGDSSEWICGEIVAGQTSTYQFTYSGELCHTTNVDPLSGSLIVTARAAELENDPKFVTKLINPLSSNHRERAERVHCSKDSVGNLFWYHAIYFSEAGKAYKIETFNPSMIHLETIRLEYNELGNLKLRECFDEATGICIRTQIEFDDSNQINGVEIYNGATKSIKQVRIANDQFDAEGNWTRALYYINGEEHPTFITKRSFTYH